MALTKPYPVNPEVHLPATLEWFRQTANWLVSLATGALAVGLATADKISLDHLWQKIVVSLGVLALLVPIGSGLLFYVWITSFANHLERRDKLACFHKNEGDDAEKVIYLEEHETASSQMETARIKYDLYYKIMLVSSVVAVIPTMFIMASLLFREQPDKQPKLTIFSRNTATDNQTYMMDENTGNTWVLTPDTNRTLVWKHIPVSTLPVASTSVAGAEKK